MTKAYGFVVGDFVRNLVEITDDENKTIPVNTYLRIVAIAPKIHKTSNNTIQLRPLNQDKKTNFVNLVRGDQQSDYGNRFRVHFVTIKKIKK